jgi:hypothetical protein
MIEKQSKGAFRTIAKQKARLQAEQRVRNVPWPHTVGIGWWKLTTAERVALCHKNAGEAIESAQSVSTELKASYLKVANKWGALAVELERENET